MDELRYLDENKVEHFGPVPWVKPENLNETGWGVIFPAGDDPKIKDIRDALSELLDHRREQAGADQPKYYREFIGNDRSFSVRGFALYGQVDDSLPGRIVDELALRRIQTFFCFGELSLKQVAAI